MEQGRAQLSDTPSRCPVVHYNPAAADFQQNPFPSLQQIREHDPVHLTRQGWVVTSYEECAQILAGRDFGMRGIEGVLKKQLGSGPAFELIAHRFHSYDPPEHTRLRSLVAAAFTPRHVQTLRARVEALAELLLDETRGEASFDLVERFAYPLTSSVFTEMLGIRSEDRVVISGWTEQILKLQGSFQPDKPTLEGGNAAAASFLRYMRGVVRERSGTSGEDLLSALMAVEEGGQRLTPEEVAESAVFLANAGWSTTRNLIASAAVALLTNRAQWELLVADQSLIGAAVEEALRYDGSLVSTPRFARQETTVGKRTIAAGAPVFCLLNAANRDPSRFPDPDRFDLQRSDKKHLAFGGGVHTCLGAHLARMQIAAALGALVRRYPQLRLGPGRIEWRAGLYRGPLRVSVLT
jgi:cytochrome P450